MYMRQEGEEKKKKKKKTKRKKKLKKVEKFWFPFHEITRVVESKQNMPHPSLHALNIWTNDRRQQNVDDAARIHVDIRVQ